MRLEPDLRRLLQDQRPEVSDVVRGPKGPCQVSIEDVMMPFMDATTKKETVKKYYDEIWSKGRLALIDELMTDDYENCDPATPGVVLKGKAGMRGLVSTFREAMPDLVLAIKEQFCDGDTVVSCWEASGTQRGALMGIPPTGRPCSEIRGITITTFRGEKIARDYAIWDVLKLLRTLGALPG